jgi:L-lactate dehydrogenase complex protein LldG
MTSREKILGAVKANKPDYLVLGEQEWLVSNEDLKEVFTKTLLGIGGTVSVIKNVQEIKQYVLEVHRDQNRIVNKVPSLDWRDSDNLKSEGATTLEKIEVGIILGELGVAENGAIWIPESSMGHRVLPYICQHLIIVLPADKIVSTMNQAYAKIDIAANGFGAFIAGPSKTADIEQSLVIGAHGARSLRVFLLEV